MLLKGRSESDDLMALRSLNTRMELTEKEKFHYLNLEKGYEGEVKFDLLVESLQEERYIINDLLLEVNNSYFQIDTTIISQGGIHLLDTKNFEGDCYFESDKLYAVKTGREYKNPVTQLKEVPLYSANCSKTSSKITLSKPPLSLLTLNSPYIKPQWTNPLFYQHR